LLNNKFCCIWPREYIVILKGSSVDSCFDFDHRIPSCQSFDYVHK
jgi:hypothetical protein